MAEEALDHKAERRIPTISCTTGNAIVELVYDPGRHTTALVVGREKGEFQIVQEFRTGAGEVLVPYSPSNSLIAHQSVLFASRPEPYGDVAGLVAEIVAFLERYVDFSTTFTRIAAHYVLLSWVFDAFNEVPYLRLQGEYGTGKTRGLFAIGLLCYKAFFASGASTVSPIFHILDTFGGTLILDESDFRFSDGTSELVKILNNGTVSGLPVLRTMQNRDRELNPRAFRVFGPKIVAMRGAYQDAGLESRFLTENMNARMMRPNIPIHTPPSMRGEALALRNKLLRYRLSALSVTEIDSSRATSELEPRLNQIGLPLLSIVDDPSLRAEIGAWLSRQGAQSAAARPRERLRAIVRSMREAFETELIEILPLREIAERVHKESGLSLSTKQLGSILREQLGLSVSKSDGLHVVLRTELQAVRQSAERLRIGA